MPSEAVGFVITCQIKDGLGSNDLSRVILSAGGEGKIRQRQLVFLMIFSDFTH